MTSIATITETRLALAIDAARLGTWTWDMASGITVWDERLEEMHGLPPGGFGGTYEDWVAALHPEDRDDCIAHVSAALERPGPYMLLHRTTWPDGSIHFIECRGTVLLDDAGEPAGTTGIAIDVTLREHHKSTIIEALAREQRVVQTLQNALLPARLPLVPGVEVAARYVAAETETEVGGDWYAVIPLADGLLGLAIGDVAGHGLHAVADMAAARFSLRALALTERDPARVLDRLNEVVGVFSQGTMITALYGVLDPGAGTWSYARAGHCPVVLRQPDGRTSVLDDGGDPPLGVASSFHTLSVPVESHATLILYTDGLIERRGESLTVGLDRLEEACRRGPTEVEPLCDHLLDVMLDGSPCEDDVGLVVVRTIA